MKNAPNTQKYCIKTAFFQQTKDFTSVIPLLDRMVRRSIEILTIATPIIASQKSLFFLSVLAIDPIGVSARRCDKIRSIETNFSNFIRLN